ncbi:N-acetylneuraminic acid mutarotase [Deinococcus metalli]|uniref:N-acetylneuraminic acid mutarotase n=1 Tax=Deinococcus metalli TaxID=1141878 RepID=A0A7W8NLU1_9DEIO|nr:NPCBM/NEW2 domain-containing protein [Deinococcus metalli]MBB5375049.1 N-acetylneuraminic acid mutarotase [Deinococcus metalli]GHF31847.1 hypothetical protein GCM10017781_05490 [Deinococcus metalli]
MSIFSPDRPAPRVTRLAAVLTVTLAACTTPGTSSPQPAHTDPYGHGATHPWSDRNTSPAAIPAKLNQVSALDYSSATNGWGPLERNASNGSEQASDGRTLTVAGQTFSSGLGVHAPSEIIYTLPGTCSTITAQVGVDDETAGKGSVVFQVYGDGRKLADSGTRTGGQGAFTLSAPLKGVKEVKLVVTDAGDGIAYDHADWGSATLDCAPVVSPPPTAATTVVYTPIASQPNAVGVSEGQGVVSGGRLYVFGGFDSLRACCTPTNRVQAFDPLTNTWTARTVMPGTGLTHAGITSNGSIIYFAGGYSGLPGPNGTWSGQVFGTTQVWAFDTGSQQYSPLPALPVPLAAGQLQYLDGKLHYFGGTNRARNQDLSVHYVLDLGARQTTWTVAAPLLHARNHLGSAVLNGKIYAIGGQTGHDSTLTTQPWVEAYDPPTNTWTPLAPLPRARSHISNSTFVLGGRIIVAGGETAHNVPMADVTAYDPVSNTWTPLTPLPVARVSGVAGAIGNSFYFTGGNASAQGWKATLSEVASARLPDPSQAR